MIGYNGGQNDCLAGCDGGEKENGRRQGPKELLSPGEKVIPNTSITEAEVFVRAPQNFTLEEDQKSSNHLFPIRRDSIPQMTPAFDNVAPCIPGSLLADIER